MRFDSIWIENRLKARKSLTGRNTPVDPNTGFLSTNYYQGFTVKKKQTFLERYRLCNNFTAICKSLKIDPQTVYDAIAIDKKFRDEINEIYEIPGRPKNLNEILEAKQTKKKNAVIDDLMGKLKEYE